MDLQQFDIANYAGHRALDELHKAYLIYTTPISVALSSNNVHVTSLDFKPQSDIVTLAAQKTVRDLRVEDADPIYAFHWSTYLRQLMQKEAEFCLNASVFFQVMMESVINDALGVSATGSFKSKWHTFLDANNASSADKDCFNQYFDKIYKAIRNKVVHPESRRGVIDARVFRFPYVHENLRCGWFAFVCLTNKTDALALDYASNWAEMTEVYHSVPAQITPADYSHLGELAGQMMRKHQSSFNADMRNQRGS